MGEDAWVYRGFKLALGDRITGRCKEIADIVATQNVMDDYEAKGVPLADVAPELAHTKKRFSLTWDPDDPQQAAASAAFPDAKPFDADRYLRLICGRFDITFDKSEEAYKGLLQAVLDEQAEAEESRTALESANRARMDADEKLAKAAETAKGLEGRLGGIDAALRRWASETEVDPSDADTTETLIDRLRAKRPAAPESSGYCDAILRTIARKCDIENAGSLSGEELVKQITDALDNRLIPKGMRIRKVGSR